jgi:hypothetical protein
VGFESAVENAFGMRRKMIEEKSKAAPFEKTKPQRVRHPIQEPVLPALPIRPYNTNLTTLQSWEYVSFGYSLGVPKEVNRTG